MAKELWIHSQTYLHKHFKDVDDTKFCTLFLFEDSPFYIVTVRGLRSETSIAFPISRELSSKHVSLRALGQSNIKLTDNVFIFGTMIFSSIIPSDRAILDQIEKETDRFEKVKLIKSSINTLKLDIDKLTYRESLSVLKLIT